MLAWNSEISNSCTINSNILSQELRYSEETEKKNLQQLLNPMQHAVPILFPWQSMAHKYKGACNCIRRFARVVNVRKVYILKDERAQRISLSRWLPLPRTLHASCR